MTTSKIPRTLLPAMLLLTTAVMVPSASSLPRYCPYNPDALTNACVGADTEGSTALVTWAGFDPDAEEVCVIGDVCIYLGVELFTDEILAFKIAAWVEATILCENGLAVCGAGVDYNPRRARSADHTMFGLVDWEQDGIIDAVIVPFEGENYIVELES